MTNEYIPSIFIAYSHKDKAFFDELKASLSPLLRRKKASIWSDGKILPGDVWDAEIKMAIHNADIILLLISTNALHSDYFYEKEVSDALLRHEKNQARVIPIILTHCLWDETPLFKLQALPQDAKPISEWVTSTTAWNDVARGIRVAIDEITQQRIREEKKRLEIELQQQKLKEEEERLKKVELDKKEEEDRHLGFTETWIKANNLMNVKDWKAAEALLRLTFSQWEIGFIPSKERIAMEISKCVSKQLLANVQSIKVKKSSNWLVNKINSALYITRYLVSNYAFVLMVILAITCSVLIIDRFLHSQKKLVETRREFDISNSFLIEYKKTYPFIIKKITFNTKDSVTAIAEENYPPLARQKVGFLVPVLHYYSLKEQEVEIFVKIFDPNEKLVQTPRSPKRYTYLSPKTKISETHTFYLEKSVELYSFGYGMGSSPFRPGYHRVEIWCNGLCLAFKYIEFI